MGAQYRMLDFDNFLTSLSHLERLKVGGGGGWILPFKGKKRGEKGSPKLLNTKGK